MDVNRKKQKEYNQTKTILNLSEKEKEHATGMDYKNWLQLRLEKRILF